MQAMNWNDLAILLAVSRSQTVTEAAAHLGVVQTTVSRRLDALEDSLGVALVERGRDGVRLTEEGVIAARAAEQMEGLVHEVERSIIGASAELAGALTVTIPPMLADEYPDLFAVFAAQHPKIELEVATTLDAISLARREADVAIRMTNQPAESLYGRRLARMEYGVYGAHDLVASVSSRALDAFPWLTWRASVGAKLTAQWMKREVPAATIVCRYDSGPSLRAGVRAGAGIGFLPCVFGDADPLLTRLLGPVPEFGYDMWVLTHQDLANTARVRAFMTHVAGYFAARAPAFAGVSGIS